MSSSARAVRDRPLRAVVSTEGLEARRCMELLYAFLCAERDGRPSSMVEPITPKAARDAVPALIGKFGPPEPTLGMLVDAIYKEHGVRADVTARQLFLEGIAPRLIPRLEGCMVIHAALRAEEIREAAQLGCLLLVGSLAMLMCIRLFGWDAPTLVQLILWTIGVMSVWAPPTLLLDRWKARRKRWYLE